MRIYLDNAATTQLDSRVLEVMMPYLTGCFGNPSSLHFCGTWAKEQVVSFRRKMAGLINAHPLEIIFTSGGTEANNLALKGVAFANKHRGNHIIVSSIEHDSILATCKWLESQGFCASYLPTDSHGFIEFEKLAGFISHKTVLVSVMHANNEIGTIQPIEEIGKLCQTRNIYFHTDACQSFGKIPIDVVKHNISLMSLNGHKIYGPKGVGCLYVKQGTRIVPLLHGGGQEQGFRSTTENLAGIAGFVTAAELSIAQMEEETARLTDLKNYLIKELQQRFEGFYINGNAQQQLPNFLNFSISGLEGESIKLLLLLDDNGIAVSTGSACSNNDSAKSASHVLQAMGKNQFEARGAIRISLGRFNTIEDIDVFLKIFTKEIKKLKPIFTIN